MSKTKLRDLARVAKIVKLPAGSCVVRQGDSDVSAVYVLTEGHCTLTRTFSFCTANRWPSGGGESESRVVTTTRSVTVKVLDPGALFGLEGVVREQERRFTVRAKTDIELLQLAAVPASPFDAQVSRNITEEWTALCTLLEKRKHHAHLSRKLEREGRRLVYESVGPVYVSRTADTHSQKLPPRGSLTSRATGRPPSRSSRERARSPLERARRDHSPRQALRLTHR